jgi:hypothetical protein
VASPGTPIQDVDLDWIDGPSDDIWSSNYELGSVTSGVDRLVERGVYGVITNDTRLAMMIHSSPKIDLSKETESTKYQQIGSCSRTARTRYKGFAKVDPQNHWWLLPATSRWLQKLIKAPSQPTAKCTHHIRGS